MVKSTGDLERGAADAIRPIFESSLKELGLGPVKAERLVRRIAEAYMTGRADGISESPPQANRALTAKGIAIALGLQYRPSPSRASGGEYSAAPPGRSP